jgi:microcystin-dependent protein
MAYELRFTDFINKGVIIVEDNTIEQQNTSLKFPGRSATGFGKAIGENFLHLLENFANSSPPSKPVEGQLWYDTTPGVDQLKLYDGTTWTSASGLKKSETEPNVSNSIAGDLWVNTERQQLFLYTGAAWVLVGPNFSDGLLTGAQSETIIGTDDQDYNVLVVRIEDRPAVIFSSRSFVPKSAIRGFRTGIKPGVNISDRPLVEGEDLKYWGTAEKAENLIVEGQSIRAENFLRGNAVSSTDFQIRVKSNQGLQIGTGGQLNVNIDGQSVIFQNNTSGSSTDFRMRDGNTIRTVLTIDSTSKVGINNTAPDEDLDILGNLQIAPKSNDSNSGIIRVETPINSTSVSDGSIITLGGVGIGLNLNVGGDTRLLGELQTADIVPDTNRTRNIGSNANRYDQIFSTTFVGNLQGNVAGTVSGRAGSADRLTSATTFSVDGDVEFNSFAFDGQTGGSDKSFDVRIRNSFISNKESILDAGNADEILINRTTGQTGVFRISKRNFLKNIPLVPVGAIMPYGGNEAPAGWLLCDGTEVRKSDYTDLWQAIGFNFRDPALISDNGVNFFALPDLRGRFALGLDNMGGPSANRVTSGAANQIGNSLGSENISIGVENLPEHEHDFAAPSGAQYYGIRVGAGTPLDSEAITLPIEPGGGGTQGFPSSGGIKTTSALGQSIDVMNPYLAVNYIIYTGI